MEDKKPKKKLIELKRVEDAVLQVVYVLTSTDKDPYLEQMWLSVRSLRWHNAHTKVVAVTDRVTYDALTPIRKEMLETVDEVIVVDLDPELSGKVRSRLLKTGLREIVKGDFLYIDTDTIIADTLEDMDYLGQFDLAAVYDHNVEWFTSPARNFTIEAYKPQFDISGATQFFNSGVMWAKDNQVSHDFYSLWQALYKKGEKQGCSFDQASLSLAEQSTNAINRLDDSWNAQGIYSATFILRAKIFHYFAQLKGDIGHRFTDNCFMKCLSSNIIEERKKALDSADDILADFMLGFKPGCLLPHKEFPIKDTALYWFIVNNYDKGYFKFFNFIGKVLNRIFPPKKK